MTKQSSATESELKFTLSETEAVQLTEYLNQQGLPQPTLRLSNAYFDTAAGDLNQLRIGCRIRRWQQDGNDCAEQTIKLAGNVTNGLHQRPEYNLPQGKQEKPDLTSFPIDIWPENQDISAINRALECVFKVDFERQRWLIQWPDEKAKNQLEVVLDQGFITAGALREKVFEIEVELLEGEVEHLLEFAKTITSRFNLHEFNKSKAERGFALASQKR